MRLSSHRPHRGLAHKMDRKTAGSPVHPHDMRSHCHRANAPGIDDSPLDEGHVVSRHGEESDKGVAVVAGNALGCLKEVHHSVIVVPLIVKHLEVRLQGKARQTLCWENKKMLSRNFGISHESETLLLFIRVGLKRDCLRCA